MSLFNSTPLHITQKSGDNSIQFEVSKTIKGGCLLVFSSIDYAVHVEGVGY
mgnify:FL=1